MWFYLLTGVEVVRRSTTGGSQRQSGRPGDDIKTIGYLYSPTKDKNCHYFLNLISGFLFKRIDKVPKDTY